MSEDGFQLKPTSAQGLRWLHITDLHVGKNNESQATALAELVKAVSQYAYGKPFDFVFLTGDLAFSGQRGEYDQLLSHLITPLRANPICRNAKFFSTPGNHDLDCAIGIPPAWNNLGASRQESFFHLGESGRRTRSDRMLAFKEYSDFVRRADIESVDPTSEPATIVTIETSPRAINIISAVTAFFCDKEIKDRQRNPGPVHAVRTLLHGLPGDSQSIVLGHHPIDWFSLDSEHHFNSLLVERNALYLHGHEHRVLSKCGPRGLICLGFGAAYPASIDSPPAPYYRNSFAICELADSLHVAIISWDGEYGNWRPEQHVPPDFVDRSDSLKDGYSLPLHTTRVNRPHASIASAIRNEFSIESCLWLSQNAPKRWTELLVATGLFRNVMETYMLPTRTLPAGHCQFRVKDEAGQYLVYGVSGPGDVLNYEQLQEINTELDRQDYSGCIVATLGEITGEAKTLAAQLASKKSITVLERTEIVRRAVRGVSTPLKRVLLEMDPTAIAGLLIITTTGFAVLLKERIANGWFQVVGEDGNALSESSSTVVAVRNEIPALRGVRYESPETNRIVLSLERKEVARFDRREYLGRCNAYFDEVKYAPLAALGFRFRRASLSELYVDATADVGGSSKTTHNLTRVVSEFVESLDLPQSQRDQLESQLRSRYGLNRTAEVGAARKLYQRYNNVVVLGDPGSGKTCFVQHEILAYCDTSAEQSTWYSNHLPIYVSLAEAARLLDERTHLLDICEIVSSRRGIELPKVAIENALSEGRAAFFFDGLDEVGYIDRRIALCAEIGSLVKTFAHRGNRFVLASRPAAVQPVDIPEALTYLQLKGLTEEEIRTLAGRVLTARLGGEEENSLASDEIELINRLLEDTRNSPGIARIARNPLLLTLLVLIYANTGALSARRHLIYTQAIKTLVSVRGRQTREQQISEADLRTRLGAIALSIFRRDIAEIPKRSEVIHILQPLMAPIGHERSERAKTDAANGFLQEVAEATGLLAIHSRDDGKSEDLITFMHYSFLEYYAAAGLLAGNSLAEVPSLSGNPRWRDVITLLFGILSEQSDVTPLLVRMLADNAGSEAITNYKTLLALDCASECDVPPEVSQDILAEAVYQSVASGAGRYSTELRSEIARRLEYFLNGASPRIATVLVRGLKHENPISAAAFADLVARLGESVVLSEELIAGFGHCLTHDHAVTRAAAMFAIERRPELRTEAAKDVVLTSLRGSVIEKHAALKLISFVPAFQDFAYPRILDLLEDTNSLISQAAAQCILVYALRGKDWRKEAPLLERVLVKLNQGNQDTGMSIRGVTLDRRIIAQQVVSDDPAESEMAIRNMPLIHDDDQFVYYTLMQRLRGTRVQRQKAACMDSLRACPGAIDLITIADTDAICAELNATERNVRIAAIRLLGEMPDDEQIVRSLQEHLKAVTRDPSKDEEGTETAKALAKHGRRNERIRSYALTAVLRLLPRNVGKGFGDSADQQQILSLLLVCEAVGGINDESTVRRVYEFATSFRTPLPIRRQAMRVFGRIAAPTSESVDLFVHLLDRDDLRLNDVIYAATASFVVQCHRKVEYVRRVYSTLHGLQNKLCEVWNREVARSPESIDPAALREIREAVVGIDNLMVAYDEFAERARVG